MIWVALVVWCGTSGRSPWYGNKAGPEGWSGAVGTADWWDIGDSGRIGAHAGRQAGEDRAGRLGEAWERRGRGRNDDPGGGRGAAAREAISGYQVDGSADHLTPPGDIVFGVKVRSCISSPVFGG